MPQPDFLTLRYGSLTALLKPLEGNADLLAFIRTIPPATPLVWLDSARQHAATGRWSMLGYGPWLTFIARGNSVELRTSAATQCFRAHPLEALRQLMRRYRGPRRSQMRGLGKAVGLMGFLSYELNRWIEPRVQIRSTGEGAWRSTPEMMWWGMLMVILVDHLTQRSWLLSLLDPHLPSSVARREAMTSLECAMERLVVAEDCPLDEGKCPGWGGGRGHRPDQSPLGTLEATSSQAEFETMVRRALDYIRAGDMFQANLSQRFTTSWRGEALSLYRALRRINPSPFACFLSSGDISVVSCSPERLVRVQEGRVDTRPIAGTRPRGLTPEGDTLNSLELLLSEKERAEHIMLVDLARNDLGRVCTMGSVQVNELMTLEEYSHVIHIVSDVCGQLRPGVEAPEVIRAVFPGGTITGCPKVRCMQIIQELEPVPRGLYTGSLGYLGFDGTLDLNIAIRTMVIRDRQLSFHVGAGIVADSDPEREYDETLAKAGALTAALQTVGEETPYPHDAVR